MDRRHFIKFALSGVTVLAGGSALAGCTQTRVNTPSNRQEQQDASRADTNQVPYDGNGSQTGKTLVVYYSHPETSEASDPANLTEEEDNSAVVIDGMILGNTQYVAQVVAQATGADTYRIETAHVYAQVHGELTAQAQQELNDGFRPELANPLPDLAAYDTVFFGYPIWWSELPPVASTFLEQVDLSGKNVFLFNTHGGSGDAGTPATIKALQGGATISDDNYVVSRDVVATSENDILAWVDGLGLLA